MRAEAKWDPKTNQLIGGVNFTEMHHFSSKDDMDKFLTDKANGLAGYVMPFLLCPLDSAIPTAVYVVGLIPTDLTYTQRDLHTYIMAIRANLRASGFRRVIVEAADNAPQHGKEFLLRMSASFFEAERAAPDPLSTAWCDDLSSLGEMLTLKAYRLVGDQHPCILTSDVSHWAKTWSLQPFSMARFLVLGNEPILGMHLVACQLYHKQSGLMAAHVNAGDRMDVESALKRINFAVRCEMRNMQGVFGTAVYLYFGACTASAYLDRSPTMIPLDRCRLAFRNLIFVRYWHAWLVVTGKPLHLHFISAQTYKASLLLDHAMIFIVLAFGMCFADQAIPAPSLLLLLSLLSLLSLLLTMHAHHAYHACTPYHACLPHPVLPQPSSRPTPSRPYPRHSLSARGSLAQTSAKRCSQSGAASS